MLVCVFPFSNFLVSFLFVEFCIFHFTCLVFSVQKHKVDCQWTLWMIGSLGKHLWLDLKDLVKGSWCFTAHAIETILNAYGREGVLCGMRNTECGNLKRCILRNFSCGTFRKLHLKVFPHFAFRKIQIKSNNQLRVGLGL